MKGEDAIPCFTGTSAVCTEEGVFATPFVLLTIPGNVFIAALLTSVLGIGESTYGWIVSLPAWANALQLFMVPAVARRLSARSLTIAFSLMNVAIWLLLLFALDHLPLDNPEAAGKLMLGYFAIISLTQSMAGVSWLSWIQEWVPNRIRGKYFGNRNRVLGLVTVAFILAIGEIFSRYGESMLAFKIILGVVSGFRLLSIYLMTYIYTPWSHPEKMIHEGWSQRFSETLRNRPFRLYLVFAAILAFGFSLTGPFVPVFMSQYLDFSVSRQTHLLVIASLASALTMPIWGRLCDRYGCRPVIIATGVLWMLQNYLWAILTPSLTWLLYPMWTWGGALSGGVILGSFNLVLKLTPPALKSSGISVHLAVTSLAAASAPIIAGWIISSAWIPFPADDFRYRLLFVAQPTLVISSFLLLARVPEPKASELTSFGGAFRTMRQLLVQNGFFLVGNVNFVRLLKSGVASILPKKKDRRHIGHRSRGKLIKLRTQAGLPGLLAGQQAGGEDTAVSSSFSDLQHLPSVPQHLPLALQHFPSDPQHLPLALQHLPSVPQQDLLMAGQDAVQAESQLDFSTSALAASVPQQGISA